MPIIPFVGPTYTSDAQQWDAQRSINFYATLGESGQSKTPTAMRQTPGTRDYVAIGSGPIRGCIESQGRAFFVSGNELYEVFANKTSTLRGTLNSSVGPVDMEENPTQIMITDGIDGYIFTKTTDAFAQITDPDFPQPSDLTYQDGYFIVTEAGTGFIWVSALNNGLSWAALDKTTVESSPDNLVGVISNKSNLWCFGSKVTEVFQNTGAATFPFQRVPGAIIETGCLSQNTIQLIDNSFIWLGSDENGGATVWRSNGYNAERISTDAIEYQILQGRALQESYAWVYHERGRAFYVLQVVGLNTTLCYDVSTKLWHERGYYNTATGLFEQHKGCCHIFFDQKHLIGDWISNKVYEMSLDIYEDADAPLRRLRRAPYVWQENALIPHNKLEMILEVGRGTQTGQGSDPQIMMRYSDDGAFTWSDAQWRDLGKAGEYSTRVRWHKLGRSRSRIYEVVVTDPVLVQINGAILNGP